MFLFTTQNIVKANIHTAYLRRVGMRRAFSLVIVCIMQNSCCFTHLQPHTCQRFDVFPSWTTSFIQRKKEKQSGGRREAIITWMSWMSLFHDPPASAHFTFHKHKAYYAFDLIFPLKKTLRGTCWALWMLCSLKVLGNHAAVLIHVVFNFLPAPAFDVKSFQEI